jgi:hypothetical protein
MHLSVADIWLWIVCLGLLEICHLKWIWWDRWHCRSCGEVNRHCACGRAQRIMRFF